MVCVYCSSGTQVVNSRHQRRKNHVWRRRRCITYDAVFTTTESPESSQTLSVSKHGTLEPFLRDALLVTVHDSLRHRKAALKSATELTDTIISRIYATNDSAIVERDTIVGLTATVLDAYDRAAGTHYRAFHPL